MTKRKNDEANVNVNEDVNVKEGAELTEEEQTALEVQKAATEGKEVGKKFKLSNPNTQYAEGEFTLQGDEEKALPENPSADLIQRIRSGFIVEV